MKVYKIRDKNGLYSTGGQSPNFTQGGKTWNNIGHVKNHLRQFGRSLDIYAEAEIVCVEYTEADIATYDILDFMDDINKQDFADYNKSDYKSDWRRERLEKARDRIAYLRQERARGV